MRTTKKTPDLTGQVLREIRRSSDDYLHKRFAKAEWAVKRFSEVGKITGDFLAKKLKSVETQAGAVDIDDIKIVVAIGNAQYPVLKTVLAEWKTGGLFKKTMKSIFFVWHSEFTDDSNAITLGEFNAFLNSNGIEDLASTVNSIGAAASDIDTAELYETFSNDCPWFGDSSCDVDYNLRSITFDSASAKLVLKLED